MLLPRHIHRSPHISSGERRLIFETQTAPSALETQLMDVLPREATDDELNALSAQIEAEKSSDVLQTVKASLDALKPREKSIVQYNILRIQARIDVKTQTEEQGRALQANIEAMRKQIEKNTPAMTPTSDTTPPDATPVSTPINPATAPGKTEPEAPKTIMEKVGKTVLDVKEDFMKGSNLTKAGYIAGGVVGFLAARWLWKKAFGDGTNDGFVKTSAKWMVGIGAAGLAMIGMKSVKDSIFNPEKILPPAAANVVNKGRKGLQKGANKVEKNFDDSFGTVNRKNYATDEEYNRALIDALKKKGTNPVDRKNFKTDAEYQKAMEDMLEQYRKDGGNWAIVGNSLIFMGKNGWDAIVQEIPMAVAAFNAMKDPENSNKWGDAAAIYFEGMVLYATSFGLLDTAFWTFALGPKGGLIKGAINTAGWPITIVRKGLKTVGLVIPGAGKTVTILESQAAIKGVGYTMNRLRWREINPFGEWTVGHMDDLFDELRLWSNLESRLGRHGMNKMLIGHRQDILISKLQKGVTNLYKTKGIIPDFLLKNPEAANLVDQIKSGQIADSYFGKVMDELFRSNTATPSGGASALTNAPTTNPTLPNPSNTPTPPGPKINPTPLTKEGKAMSKLMDSPEWGPILKKMGGKVAVDDVEAFLELARDAKLMELDPSTLALIRDSKQAKVIIAGAVDTADVLEVTRALQAAKSAAKWRVAGNAAGAAGDVFGLWMAYEDWKANDNKIAATTNVALKDLYKDAKIANVIEGTTSGVSLVIGGYAFCSTLAAGEGLLAAAGAVGGTIMLPVGIAVGVGVYGKKKLQDVSEEWLNEEKDWAKKSSGELLAAQAKLGPGKHGYWQGAANGTRIENWYNWASKDAKAFQAWEEAGFKRIEDANGGARYQITRAYIAKMTDLPQKNGESDTAYKTRFAEFQRLQIGFVADNTNGAFGETLNLVYRNAHTHAELKIMSEELKKNGGSQQVKIIKTDDKGQPVEKQFDIAQYGAFKNQNDRTADGITPLDVIIAYQRQKQATTLVQVQMLRKMDGSGNESVPIQDAMLQNMLLQEVRHDMTLCDKKMRETDYTGWQWTGGEEQARGVARYVMNVELRKLLRSESDRLREKSSTTQIDLDNSIQTLRAFLQQEPANFEVIAKKNNYGGATEFANNSEVLTDYRWTREHLYLHPPATPQLKDAA